MSYVRSGALIALPTVAGCGGGAFNEDLVKACIASEGAIEQEMAARFSSHRPASPAVMDAKRDCCRRTIEGSKLPGSVKSYLLKVFEYKTLRSTSQDQAAVMNLQDETNKKYEALSDKDRQMVSGTNMLLMSCTSRAAREE